jgi:hypothetical protein
MPILKQRLEPEGAIIPLLVGLSDASVRGLRIQLLPIPQSLECRALLDSGADITCVDSRLIESMNLVQCGFSFANVPSLQEGTMLEILHDLSLTILHPSTDPRDHLLLRNWRVMELPLGSLDYQVLIGRDVLNKCQFVFDGINRRFSLRYDNRVK